jgi:hypothetical protein
MSIKYKLNKSRNNWKEKAIIRGQNLRYQCKENHRVKQERDRYKKEAGEAKKQLESELRKKSCPVCNKETPVYIVLSLFLVARVAFRSISRVLAVLGDYLGETKAPCTQTICAKKLLGYAFNSR